MYIYIIILSSIDCYRTVVHQIIYISVFFKNIIIAISLSHPMCTCCYPRRFALKPNVY